MLPITTHRSFHVPHTLAVAAALAALIAAFGWSADQATLADAEVQTAELVADAEAGHDPETRHLQSNARTTADGSTGQGCGRSGSCLREHSPGLFPFVLPALPSR